MRINIQREHGNSVKLSSHERNINYKILFLLSILFFLPTGLFFHLSLSSLAVGTAAAAAIFFIDHLFGGLGPARRTSTFSYIYLAALLFVATHIVLTYLMGEPDLIRPFSSLALLAGFLFVSQHLGYTLFSGKSGLIRPALAMIGLFFVFIAASILGLSPEGDIRLDKPIYPFTEPSHLAFTIAPLLIFCCATANNALRLILLLLFAIAALWIENLTLMVVVFLAAACSLNWIYLAIFVVFAISSAAVIDITYFLDRIDLVNTTNLSALVYRQGFELMAKSLHDTGWWGIGFQRLGFTNLYTPTSDLIYALSGNDLNLRDGGYTFSKLVSEFGIFGIILVAIYLWKMVPSALILRSVASGSRVLSPQTIFAISCFVGFAIELFIRGGGYFTPTALLAVAAIPYIQPDKIQREARNEA